MSFPVALVVAYVLAFCLGSIPTGVVIGKVFFGIDPRSGGSGSIGATNSNRMLGAKGGVAVLLLDMLKGAVAVGIARLLIYLGVYSTFQVDMLLMGSAFFGIAGHIYSPWLGFKGGKGISTGFGTLLVACPPIALGISIVFIAFAFTTRWVSLGSIMAAISVTVWAILFNQGSVPFAVFGALISLMVVFAHRANIQRLAKGVEPKFSPGKSPKEGKDA